MYAALAQALSFGRRYALAALIACMVLAGGASAEPPPPKEGPPPRPAQGPPSGGPLDHALEQIELPDDVRADVDAMLDQARKERRTLHRSLKAAHAEMRTRLEATEPDEASILAQADVIGALRTELEKVRLRTLLQINRRLSPDQRAALTRELQKREKRRPPRHGDRRGEPGP